MPIALGILLPVAIGIAVLRYRLYEIDVLLNWAVLYGLLTAFRRSVAVGPRRS